MCLFINDLIIFLKNFFLNIDASLLQNTGIALLTLLIPVAQFMLDKAKSIFFEWDKNVIIDKVVDAKKLMLSIAFIFIPVIFLHKDLYSTENELICLLIHIKVILLLIFVFGIFLLVTILFNAYKWLKVLETGKISKQDNFRNICRNKYLNEIKNDQEKAEVWHSTWSKEKININDEAYFIEKFIAD